MVNISGTLYSLSATTGHLYYNSTNNYYAWSSSQIDAVCQALKNLLINNVPALSVLSSTTNSYVLRHSGMESGYGIRIYGYASASTSSQSYIRISEGTLNGTQISNNLIDYTIYPYISGCSGTSQSSGTCGAVTWNWSYQYRLVVDDSGNSFALNLSRGAPSNPFAFSAGDYDSYTYNSSGYYSGTYGHVLASSSGAKLVIAMMPVSGVYYLTFFEQNHGRSRGLGASIIAKGYGSSGGRWDFIGPTRSFSKVIYLYYGWTIYNRLYVMASTMYPNAQVSDYGQIKMVKLGCCEYGLPYIVDNTYMDNFFACERNTQLVDNQIIVIDGMKYLYSSSGYLFKLGAVPTPLAAPTISLSGDTLTITPVTNATSYKVYSDGTLTTTVSTTTVDLSSLHLAAGTHSITVRASATGYLDSDPSTAVSYTVSAPSGYSVTLSSGVSTWGDYYDQVVYSVDGGAEEYLNNETPGSVLASGASTISFGWRSGGGGGGDVTYTMGGQSATVDANDSTITLTGDMVITAYGGMCLTGDTLITMADGTQKRIDTISVGDKVLAYDPDTMKLIADEVTYSDANMSKSFHQYDIWRFSDGSELHTVHRHRLYNAERGAMVYMDEWAIGEHAVTLTGGHPALVAHETVQETVRHYTIFTRHQNYFANGLLSGNRKTKQIIFDQESARFID